MPQVVSANRLTDGIVVFLGASGWGEKLADAQLFETPNDAKAGLARAEADQRANLIIEITPFDVDVTPSGLAPKHLRDKVRCAGPTVHRDHGKQAE